MFKPTNVNTALQIDVAITTEMAAALQRWSAMYTNQSPWLVDTSVHSLNLAASIAAEIARAVTIEMEVQLTGGPRATFLLDQLTPVLNNIRTYTEYAAAKGGIMFKPYIKGEQIAIDYVQADMFYPVAFDANGNMIACVFADQQTIGRDYYTRLEYHTLADDGYHIINKVFRSTTKETLGSETQLTAVAAWADLEPEAVILNVDKPLFSYFKMPFANNIDTTSPLGVSVYARAVSLIEQADRTWSDFLWELESGERALYTDPMAFGKTTDGKPILPHKRLYRTLDLQTRVDGAGLFEDWTPTIREQNYLNSLDAILRRIEFASGLAYGVLSNPNAVQLTATEIRAAQQRFYATVTDTQKELKTAVDDLLYAMDVWATIGNLAPMGTYTTTFQFDDSIISDHDAQFLQDQQAVSMGAMALYEFRMRTYGEDIETAKKMVAEVQKEKPAPTSFFPAVE